MTGKNPFLRQAKELHEKLEYEKCLQRLAQAPQWKSARNELVEIELYAGLCHFNLNQRVEAEERFRLALRMNAGAQLPEYSGPKLLDFFGTVSRKLKNLPPTEPPPKPSRRPAPRR